MPKASTSEPSAAPAVEIKYPPEILAIKTAIEDVRALQASIADNTAFAQEQARNLEIRLFNTDLRGTKDAAELATLHTHAALCEQRGALLADELERLLTGLRTRNNSARTRLCKDAAAVAEGRAQAECQGKQCSAEDKARIANHHGKLVESCSRISWEQPARFAPEIARQILDRAAEVYAELPEYQGTAGGR